MNAKNENMADWTWHRFRREQPAITIANNSAHG